MMKVLNFLAVLMASFGLHAQEPCEFVIHETDSLGTYKETADYLVAERNFAGTATYVYFALVLDKEMPLLKMQFISRSKEFISANCLNSTSKAYLQLDNGKIATLFYRGDLSCGTSVRNQEGFNNNILTAYFAFSPTSFEDLMISPVALMRVKFASETKDYLLSSVLHSELHKSDFKPQQYFVDTLECLTTQ